VLVDPMGQVTMRQKVLPLNRKITRFAQARPAGPGRYDVDRVQIGGRDEQGWDTVRDYFSPAQFTEMSDAEKLSRPSFEKMDAGITVGSNAIGYGKSRTVSKGIVYETTIVDSPRETRKPAAAKDRLYALPLGHQRAMTGLGAAARSPLRSTGNERFMPPPATPAQIALDDEQFAVVSTDDLGVLIKTATRSEAHQALADHLAGRPEQRGRLQVVPLHELEVPQ
jgi:hypothetical protein